MQAKKPWRGRAIAAGTGFLGLLLGLGIAAPNKDQTKTVTQTQTKTATQVVTHTSTVVPESCSTAIADARHLAAIIGSAFDHSSGYIPLVARAANAAAEEDVAGLESVTADEKLITSKIEGDAGRVSSEASRFNKDAAGCKTSA